MKSFLLGFGLFFMTQFAQAWVEFEVQPLSLEPQAEVMGVHTGVVGQDAIIFTGHSARKIAEEGHFACDTNREMIVMTGEEVRHLIAGTLGGVYGVGKMGIITSASFARAGLAIAFNAIYMGAQFTYLAVTTAATIGKTIVSAALIGIAHTVYWVADTGLRVAMIPAYVVGSFFGFVCEIPNYFGHRMMACEY